MITMAYKVNKLKGIEVIEKAVTHLLVSDDHESNKEMIRCSIEALEQLAKNEDLMFEYEALVAGIKNNQPADEIEKAEDLA